MKRFRYLLIAVLMPIAQTAFANKDDENFAVAKNLQIFNEVVRQINIHYVDSIPMDKIVKYGIDAMLHKLDPYTNYYTDEGDRDYKMMTKGQYGGVGAVISKRDDYVTISKLFEGMPAQIAGLIPGDKILEIDGKDMKGKTTSEVSESLRGIPGTDLTVTIERINEKKHLKIKLTRANVQEPTIPLYTIVNDSIGYIHLSQFTTDCSVEIGRLISEMKGKGMKSLVLDLQGNPGGLLNEACSICNFFIPKGEVVTTTRGKNNNIENLYKTSNEPLDLDMPLVILVNDYSASASEIVSGAMQDLDRAVIIGSRTFGKGLVQGTYPLPYNSKVKVTTAKYYIPSGRCIQAINYTTKDDEQSAIIPDSLTSEFETRAGRKVRDGRGITPDIVIEDDSSHQYLSYFLFNKLYIYDYANLYYSKHKSIAPFEQFVADDLIFDEFKQFVNEKGFDYKSPSQQALDDLIKTAKEDGLYEANQQAFESMKEAFSHDINKEMDEQKATIIKMLTSEIAERYYYLKGSYYYVLLQDDVFKKACEILTDQTIYREILRKK